MTTSRELSPFFFSFHYPRKKGEGDREADKPRTLRQRGREEDGRGVEGERGSGEGEKYKYDIQDMKICEGDKDAQRIKSSSSFLQSLHSGEVCRSWEGSAAALACPAPLGPLAPTWPAHQASPDSRLGSAGRGTTRSFQCGSFRLAPPSAAPPTPPAPWPRPNSGARWAVR